MILLIPDKVESINFSSLNEEMETNRAFLIIPKSVYTPLIRAKTSI